MSSGVEKRDIKGLIDNVSVANIICIYIFNKHCDMDFLHRNILRYSFSGRYSPLVFTIYGHGGHLGHVTWIIYIYIGNPFLLMLNIKLSFDWPRGFREVSCLNIMEINMYIAPEWGHMKKPTHIIYHVKACKVSY